MRTIFSSEEVAELRRNTCVFSCSERSINYTYEFKTRALELHSEGISPKEIWKRAGFDISKWKKNYCKDTLKDWKRMVKKGGLESLIRMSGVQADTGRTRGISIDVDRSKRLELQVRYLEAENDFLAKLRAKRAESNSGQWKNSRSLES